MLYGCWLNGSLDFDKLKENVDRVNSRYSKAYLIRVESIGYIASTMINDLSSVIPALKGRLHLNYPSLISAIGRYFNDIAHYKLWHDVSRANAPKMLAHTIKWLARYQVVACSLTDEEYRNLTVEEKKTVLELNTIFIALVAKYLLDYFSYGDPPDPASYERVFYLIDTDQYDARTAAVIFEGVIL